MDHQLAGRLPMAASTTCSENTKFNDYAEHLASWHYFYLS